MALVPDAQVILAAADPSSGAWYLRVYPENASLRRAVLAAASRQAPTEQAGQASAARPLSVRRLSVLRGSSVVEVPLFLRNETRGLLAAAWRDAAKRPAAEVDSSVLRAVAAQVEIGLAAVACAQELASLTEHQREHDEFVSIISHDLRTPLTAVRGYAQLLLRRSSNGDSTLAEAEPSLRTILQQADRVASLTDILLDISRIRSNRLALRRTSVDLGQVARDAAERAKRDWDTASISVEAPPVGPVVSADVGRLVQIVRSMLEFAAERSMKEGEITIHISTQPRDERAGAQVYIHDEGDVLAKEETEALFKELTRQGPHRALGHLTLYIAKGVAEAHGGMVWAESPPPGSEVGARLAMWLPAQHDAVA